jgi:diphthine-ammonia ligase
MKVAILYSGGKDSNMALLYALKKGWKVEALIAVKPRNTEAYLWHYPTVEWTLLQSDALGIPVILVKSNNIGPEKEAQGLEQVFKKIDIDALVLGGVGLQKTQIKAIENVAKKFGIKLVVPYANYSSETLLRKEIESGIEAVIVNVAVDGLGSEWLGKKIDRKSVEEIIELSKKFGFDPLFEGGHADTFVLDAPFFKKRIELIKTEKVWDSKTNSGYLVIKEANLVDKD